MDESIFTAAPQFSSHLYAALIRQSRQCLTGDSRRQRFVRSHCSPQTVTKSRKTAAAQEALAPELPLSQKLAILDQSRSRHYSAKPGSQFLRRFVGQELYLLASQLYDASGRQREERTIALPWYATFSG